MGKIVDGVELLRMIRDGELNPNKKIYTEQEGNRYKFYISKGIYNAIHLYRVEGKKEIEVRVLDTDDLLNDKYIIPEEDEEIDIQEIKNLLKIEEYEVDKTDTVINRNKINELLKAIKQLDRTMKGIK